MEVAFQQLTQADFARTAVIGCPGSGKTTFTKSLGGILSRPVIHLDKVLWNPNWQMVEYPRRQQIHQDLISQDTWLIDGMWKSHLAERFPRATLVIFLDFKRSLCIKRAIARRRKYRGQQRDDIADGCLEKLDAYFLRYIWTFRRKVRPVILQLMQQHPDVKTVTFHTPEEAEAFLQQMQSAQPTE